MHVWCVGNWGSSLAITVIEFRQSVGAISAQHSYEYEQMSTYFIIDNSEYCLIVISFQIHIRVTCYSVFMMRQ